MEHIRTSIRKGDSKWLRELDRIALHLFRGRLFDGSTSRSIVKCPSCSLFFVCLDFSGWMSQSIEFSCLLLKNIACTAAVTSRLPISVRNSPATSNALNSWQNCSPKWSCRIWTTTNSMTGSSACSPKTICSRNGSWPNTPLLLVLSIWRRERRQRSTELSKCSGTKRNSSQTHQTTSIQKATRRLIRIGLKKHPADAAKNKEELTKTIGPCLISNHKALNLLLN